MSKEQLRKEAMSYLKGLPKIEKKQLEKELTEKMLGTDLWKRSHVIGMTLSMEMEWDTTTLIKAGWRQNKLICVPRTEKKGRKMSFFQLNHFGQLKNSTNSIREPEEGAREVEKKAIDLLIVPGLLFDKNGYRIGFGGGYYDRFLKDFTNHTASMCTDKQIKETLPTETHDVPVQYLLTETGLKKLDNQA
jgi:5-formyltetrahydrofolate cyclo-ligase